MTITSQQLKDAEAALIKEGLPITNRSKRERALQMQATPAGTITNTLAATAVTTPARNIRREQRAIKGLGYQPKTLEEIAAFARYTYTSNELANFSPEERQALGLNEAAAPPSPMASALSQFDPGSLTALGMTPEQIKALTPAGQAAAAARGGLASTPKPTNTALGVLQEALNAKSNVTNQSLGMSKLFERAGLPTAGVGGYAILAQSLNQRSREMQNKYNSFALKVSDVSGAMVDTYNLALGNYKLAQEEYDKQVDRLLRINETTQSHERAMEILEKDFENKKAFEQWKLDNAPSEGEDKPTFTNLLEAEKQNNKRCRLGCV